MPRDATDTMQARKERPLAALEYSGYPNRHAQAIS